MPRTPVDDPAPTSDPIIEAEFLDSERGADEDDESEEIIPLKVEKRKTYGSRGTGSAKKAVVAKKRKVVESDDELRLGLESENEDR